MEVWCGMILGFDNDDATIFQAQRQFLKEARIVSAMIGMLSAIPKTPLHARLAREGRLDQSDVPEFGTNVIPAQMTREELRDGFVQVMQDLYEPEAYFQRLEDLYIRDKQPWCRGVAKYWRRHPWTWLKTQTMNALTSVVLFARLMRGIPEAGLRREYRKRLWRLKCAMHYHQHTMAKQMAVGLSPVYNTF